VPVQMLYRMFVQLAGWVRTARAEATERMLTTGPLAQPRSRRSAAATGL
jgi:hypothetical protein